MIKDIPLKSLIPHGKITTKLKVDALEFTPKIRSSNFVDSRTPGLILPEKAKLPFRLDLSVKLDDMGFRVIVGKGLIPFTAGWNFRGIENIVDEGPKSWKIRTFDASLELNKTTDISITYDYEFMMIEINGDTRFLSKKERYMKSPLLRDANDKGFEIKITTEKFSTAVLNSLSITQYTDDEIATLRSQIKDRDEIYQSIPGTVEKGKESFDECIASLSDIVQREIKQTNDHLLDMKSLKIKRSIEGTHKGCRIKYNSPTYGFGYHIIVSNSWASHFFWFSMHFNHRYGAFGARKCDYTEEMLNKIAEKSPETAAKIFDYYGECGICVHADRSSVCPTVYEHRGIKKTTCHGQMKMNMKPETFQDIRVVFDALYDILKEEPK